MLAILLMLVGLAILVGAISVKDIAGRLVKLIGGAIALCIAIPWLVQWLGCLLQSQSASSTEHESMPKVLLVFLLFAVLGGVVGIASWKLRAFRSRLRDLSVRRHGAPRTRALPPPPSSVGGQS